MFLILTFFLEGDCENALTDWLVQAVRGRNKQLVKFFVVVLNFSIFFARVVLRSP